MKKIALFSIVAIFCSLGLSGQELKNEQKEKQIKEKKEIRNEKPATQGQVVSTVAKETPSGKGKGEVVSTAAGSKNEAKKAVNTNDKKAKKGKKAKATRERPVDENAEIQKGPRGTRPDTAGKGVVKGSARPGKGKK